MSFKPIDAKRDEYRKYLEQTGVMELLSKVIIKLFECKNKPDNAIEFIRENMGDSMLEADTISHLKQELEDSRNENAQLRRAMETLKLQLQNNKTATVAAAPAAATAAEVMTVVGPVIEELKGDNAVVMSGDDEQDHDTNEVNVDAPSEKISCPSEQNAVVDDDKNDDKDIVDEQENTEEIPESNKKESVNADPVANDQEQQISKDTPKTDAESKAE